ncbi:MAG TPA: hypothetical protein VIP11_15560 [Gemmatimonadaceae bacterium]
MKRTLTAFALGLGAQVEIFNEEMANLLKRKMMHALHARALAARDQRLR